MIFDEYNQPVLVEQYIEGREINVGLLGNSPPEALPPGASSHFGDGPAIYTYEDKTGKSGRPSAHLPGPDRRGARPARPGDLPSAPSRPSVCYDCARVDMRLDAKDQLYILEVNSLPSLGEHGSYLVGAAQVGLDFAAFVNRLVEVAAPGTSARPTPRCSTPGASTRAPTPWAS